MEIFEIRPADFELVKLNDSGVSTLIAIKQLNGAIVLRIFGKQFSVSLGEIVSSQKKIEWGSFLMEHTEDYGQIFSVPQPERHIKCQGDTQEILFVRLSRSGESDHRETKRGFGMGFSTNTRI
jgi:hypothetical protein